MGPTQDERVGVMREGGGGLDYVTPVGINRGKWEEYLPIHVYTHTGVSIGLNPTTVSESIHVSVSVSSLKGD